MAVAVVVPLTRTTRVNVDEPTARSGWVNVTVPVPPTAGVAIVHPAGALAATNVVFGGMASVTIVSAAGLGPALVTARVYVRSCPATTGFGLAALVSETLARAWAVVIVVGCTPTVRGSPSLNATKACPLLAPT